MIARTSVVIISAIPSNLPYPHPALFRSYVPITLHESVRVHAPCFVADDRRAVAEAKFLFGTSQQRKREPHTLPILARLSKPDHCMT